MRALSWKAVLLVIFSVFCILGHQTPAEAQSGYSYGRAITISYTKVPNTNQTNFPVLISGTYSYLATTANGGNVTNANGYDIVFTSDSAGADILPFEQESYSASTGAVVYWVQIPTVSHTANTTFYMFYGNSSVTTDQSNKHGTWDSNYKGVWHLANGTTLSASDSTSNANTGTVQGTVTATAGEIDGAGSFDGSSGYISTTNTFNWPLNLTTEAWMNTTSTAGHKVTGLENIQTGTWAGSYDGNLYVDTNGKAVTTCYASGVTETVVSGSAVNDGHWHQLAATLNTSTNTLTLYVDGVSQGTENCSGMDAYTGYFRIGSYRLYSWPNGNDGYFNGKIDEVRFSNTVRSADWIATEYNNESSPSTFYSVASTPSITSLSPTSGPVATSVTITGTNFGSTQGSSTVTFNGTSGTPTSWSATSIMVPVPSGATTGNVVVTVSGVASNGASFTVTGTPSISSLSPTSGPVGTSVTITGTTFGSSQGSSTVTFNGTSGTPSSWSATSIVVPVPTGATTGNVAVTVSGVSSNGVSFTVLPTPTITSLSPTSGPVGTSVTITGTTFGSTQGSSTVKFNGTSGTPTSWSATSIVVPVPSGATTGNVVVTENGVSSNGASFTVTATPTITSLSPTSGSVGTTVTITGTNFGTAQGSSTVTFTSTVSPPTDTVTAPITSWNSNGTQIVVQVPDGTTTGSVVVTVNGIASTGNHTFTASGGCIAPP